MFNFYFRSYAMYYFRISLWIIIGIGPSNVDMSNFGLIKYCIMEKWFKKKKNKNHIIFNLIFIEICIILLCIGILYFYKINI